MTSSAGIQGGSAREEAAQQLLRSLCNTDGSHIGEDDPTGGDGDEDAAEESTASGANKGFDWGRYCEAFPDTPFMLLSRQRLPSMRSW